MVTEIKTDWVECYGGESCVLTLGHGIANSLVTLENEELFIIVPGNPGLGSMYQDFMQRLHLRLARPNTSIWTFSYIGHESPTPAFLPTDSTYILEDQILHKLELLDKLVPKSAKVTLIGHSIGCKLIMEIFKRNTSHNFQDFFFLFPTIENMISTSRGAQTWSLVTTFKFPALLIFFLLSLLPNKILAYLTQIRYGKASASFVDAAVRFVNPNFLNNVLVMAKDELETVLELDISAVRNMVGKLHLYHGRDDGWSPLAYRDSLLEKVPEIAVDARIDDQDIPHAFVEFDSEKVADTLADWMKEIEVQK